jgi:hypothetical protein
MKNKAITFLIVIVALGVFAGVAFGGSNIQTFYNDNLKDAVDSGITEAKEAGGVIVGNAEEFALSVY